MARDWGPALGQVSLQSSEQRQLLLILPSHVCMAAPDALISTLDKHRAAVGDVAIYAGKASQKKWKNAFLSCIMA